MCVWSLIHLHTEGGRQTSLGVLIETALGAVYDIS